MSQPTPSAVPASPAPAGDAQRLSPAARQRAWIILTVVTTAAAAAALAYGLEHGLSVPQQWAAPLGAALAVLAASVPVLAWFMPLGPDAATPADARQALRLSEGMPRALFLELAEREWSRARRYGTGAALLLVDIDRFAALLEARGPSAVDAVVAALLKQTAPTLRSADVIARFADAQMAVFLAQSDATGALDVAERIRDRTEQLEVPHVHQGQAVRIRVTVSVGVAQLRPAHQNLQALVDDAHDAISAARMAGGNCVRAAPVDPPSSRSTGWRDDQRARRK